jgi:GDP-4-dehydro-6-deoxy-D-mannose reductase
LKTAGDTVMRVLVTGAAGFVGNHLVAALVKRRHEVFGAVFRNEQASAATPVLLDITDKRQTCEALRRLNPDAVVHLAAQSKVSLAWEEPAVAVEINTVGTINLMLGIRNYSPAAKIVIAGSSEEYGLTGKAGEALTELSPCLPNNPYAVSKYAAGQIAGQIARRAALKLYYMRPFNHFGPGQPCGFIISDLCSQIAGIEKGHKNCCLEVGDLSARRDFTYIDDIVAAYLTVLNADIEPGTYNICSGIARSGQEILEFLTTHAAVPLKISADHRRFRPSEIPLFCGSSQKLQHCTGWRPTSDFHGSLLATLDWWRRR